eukprot:8907986-Alexandrium_andersonii.AAC.1
MGATRRRQATQRSGNPCPTAPRSWSTTNSVGGPDGSSQAVSGACPMASEKSVLAMSQVTWK